MSDRTPSSQPKSVAISRLVVAVAVIAALAGAVYLARRQPEPLRIGFIGTLSGRFAALGGTALEGARLAVAGINQRGGVAGRELHLVVKDDHGEPARSAEAARSLLADDIRIILGPLTSASGEAVVAATAGREVLVLSPTVASDAFTGLDDQFVRLIPSTSAMGRNLGQLLARFDRGPVVLVGDLANRSYVDPLFAGLSATAPGRRLHRLDFHSQVAVAHEAVAAAIAGLRPQVVVFATNALDAAVLAQHLRHEPGVLTLINSPWGTSSDLLHHGGAGVDGMWALIPAATEHDSPTWLDFAHRYQERFAARPSFAAIFNAEGVDLLAAAWQAAGDDPRAMRAWLTDRVHHGLQGPFTIDASGDCRRPLVVHRVEAGRFVPVTGAPGNP